MMRGFSLLRSLAEWLVGNRASGHRTGRSSHRRRPRVEPLEERRLLAVLYVNDDAAGLNTGVSWADAYTDLQSALTAAAANDEIWVAAGTYKPTSGTDQTVSFELQEDVDLYGGFAGTETARDQRDWPTNVTTLSGDLGVADTTSDNSNHVVSASSITDARLDGFTITAGCTTQNTGVGYFGAGMLVDNASPVLANLVFSENTVFYGGGGALYVAGSPTLENVVFCDNHATTLGGNSYGGAMYIASGSPTLTDVVFESNTAAATMGGHCYGAALYQSDGTATLTNVVFRGNSTSNDYSSIAYCGGFYIAGGTATLTNATFYDNRATASHSTAYDYALQVAGGSATVTNSILWGETYACPISGNATVTYSIVWGGYTGTGNLNVAPQFVDADNGDFSLQSISPAIDAGTSTDAPTTDIDGTARPLDGNGDGIAAYEAATLVDTAPVADAGGPYTVFAGSSIALSAAASTRSSTAIVLYEWDLDYDGTTFDVDATGARPDFSAATLSAGDTRTVALRVTARSGLTSDVSTATVSVVAYQELALETGSAASSGGSVSLDGRYTVLVSRATDLVADDTNGTADVFVQDGLTGTITRVSTDSEGNQANADCYNAYISSEGPYVVFNTAADNLVDGDTASGQKVFVKDLTTGAITLVSTTAPPAEGMWGNFEAQAISADGRYVIYKTISYSGTDRYHPTPTYWLLMKDLSTDEVTTLYSQETSEALVAFSAQSAFAADGRYVIFTAEGEGYVYDLWAGSATSLDAADSVAISGDGRYAVFASSDSLVADDTNGVADVYAKDMFSGDVVLVSSDSSGTPADGESYTPSMSADGRYVVFLSAATNLVGGDTNASTDAFVKDLVDGTLRCASNDAEGNPASAAGYPAISADGRYVVYSGHRAFNPLLDAVPTDIALSAAVVVERAAAGTVVGTLSTTDADAGETFTYSLVAGDGDADNGQFTIVGDQLAVLGLVDAQSSYSVRVRSTDSLGHQSCEKVFTIEVQWLTESVGLYDPATSTFYLRYENSTGSADRAFAFGVAGAGWEAIVGDWDGDGQCGVGLYDPQTSTFYLTNSFASGAAQYTFAFGVAGAGWGPVAGDWDGDGQAGVGLYDPATSTFYLTNSFTSGVAEYAFGFGVPASSWTPIVGDWNGDLWADVGLYDAANGAFYLTTERLSGTAQYMFNFGILDSTWQPLAGDWNASGASGVGLYDAASSTFYLTNSLSGGTAETAFGYGPAATNWVALAGVWTLDAAVNAEAVDQLDLSDLAAATLSDLDAAR
jgi:hypothetical protein